MLAKTGTLRHVNALAGYVTTRSGTRLAFVRDGQPPHRGRIGRDGAIDEIGALLASV